MLDLLVRSGVHDDGPIAPDVVFIANQRNFLSVNCVPLSVMMEFGTPKQWMMLRKNSMAYSDLIIEIGRASIHLVKLSMVTSKWV